MLRTRQQIDKLIADNMGLVYSESMRWGAHLDPEEREAAGLRGLGKAAMIWNPKRAKLSTLASWWIRAECSRVKKDMRSHWRERPDSECRMIGRKDVTIIGIAENPQAPCPLTEAARVDAREQVERFLSLLPPDAAQIIRMRHGIGCVPSTLQKIADVFGGSHTTAVNDYNRAMAHLKRIAAWTGAECAA